MSRSIIYIKEKEKRRKCDAGRGVDDNDEGGRVCVCACVRVRKGSQGRHHFAGGSVDVLVCVFWLVV